MSSTPDDLTHRLAEAKALLESRGHSVLVPNAYGDSSTAIWTGLVRRMNGMRNDQKNRPMTLISLIGGGQVFADLSVEQAHALLMPVEAAPSDGAMTTARARAVLSAMEGVVVTPRRLSGDLDVIESDIGDHQDPALPKIRLDGFFTAAQLGAIAAWMRDPAGVSGQG